MRQIGGEAEHQHHDREDRERRSARAERLVLVQHPRVARADQRTSITTITTVVASQEREKKHIAAAPITVTVEMIVEWRCSVAWVMCPPSSWPNGSRLSAVASIPNQAAKTIGCALSDLAVGDRARTPAEMPPEEQRLAELQARLDVRRRDDVGHGHAQEQAPGPASRTRRSGRRRRCRRAPSASGTARGS